MKTVRTLINSTKALQKGFATKVDPSRFLVIGAHGNMATTVMGPNISRMVEDGHSVSVMGNRPKAHEIYEGLPAYFAQSDDPLPPKDQEQDFVLYFAKPDQTRVLSDLAKNGNIGERTTLVTAAAGNTMAKMLSAADNKTNQAIRVMPSKLGDKDAKKSSTSFTTTGNIPEDKLDYVCSIYSQIGQLYAVEEKEMNKMTALAGSGPASIWTMCDVVFHSLRDRYDMSKEEARNLIIEVGKDFDNLRYAARSGSEVSKALGHLAGSDVRTIRSMNDGAIKHMADYHKAKDLEMPKMNEEEQKQYIADKAKEQKQVVAGIFMQMRGSLIRGVSSVGIDTDFAGSIVKDLVVGASIVAERTPEKNFAELAEGVRSPGGTTAAEEGVIFFDKGNPKNNNGPDYDDVVKRGLVAAINRGSQMGDPLGYASEQFMRELKKEENRANISAFRAATSQVYNQLRLDLDLATPPEVLTSKDDSGVKYGEMKPLQKPAASNFVETHKTKGGEGHSQG